MPSANVSETKSSGISLWMLAIALPGAIGLAARGGSRARRDSGARQPRPGQSQDGVDRPFGEPSESEEPIEAQHARAKENGRGRDAENPAQIPARGWKDIAWRVYEEINKDRLLAVAAGVVFYGLLALFPAVTALVSSYALFAEAATIGKHLAFAAALMPGGAFSIVEEQINRIASTGGGGLSVGFIFGLLLAIWSANAGIKAMLDALNVIYGETEKRGFIKLNLVSLAMTLGALIFLLLAIATVVVLPLVFAWLGIEGFGQWLLAALRWPVIMVVIAFGLGVLYRFGPSRDEARWQWLSVGAVVATLLWIAGSALFSWYLSNFADYNATYGSLGAGIGLMMWLWLTTISILLGAEINAEIEHQTARDTTKGHKQPLGARGAVMADTVGEAKS
jgi:membrane protein